MKKFTSEEGEKFLRDNGFFPYQKDHLEEIYTESLYDCKEIQTFCEKLKNKFILIKNKLLFLIKKKD